MFPTSFNLFTLFRRNKTPDYEQPFAAKYGLRTAEQQKEFDEHMRSLSDRELIAACEKVPRRAPEPNRLLADQHAIQDQFYKELQKKRPGDTEPKQYLNTTNANLVKTINTYETEIAKLDKDISKLTEERRQAQIAVDGLRAAVAHISGGEQTQESEIERILANTVSDALTNDENND